MSLRVCNKSEITLPLNDFGNKTLFKSIFSKDQHTAHQSNQLWVQLSNCCNLYWGNLIFCIESNNKTPTA